MKGLTRELHLGKLCFFLFLFLGLNLAATAQEEVKDSKKITIVTKKIDSDGKEIIEKQVIEGADAADADIDALIEKAKKEAKEIEVSIEEEETHVMQQKKKGGKKVIITTKKLDKDGKETVEKRVLQGDDLDDAKIEALIAEAKKGAKEVDVRIEEMEVDKMDKGGKNIWIGKDGAEIDLDKMKGENVMIFKTEDGEVIELNEEKGTKEGKQITIITKKKDKDGKEIIEKKVMKGTEAEDVNIDELIEKAKKEAGGDEEKMEIRVRKQKVDGGTRIRLEKDGEALHEEHIVIEKEGDGKNAGKQVKVMTVTVDENGDTKIEERVVENANQEEEMEVTVTVDEDGNTKIIKQRKKVEDIEGKLEKMGIKLPVLGAPVANYVHAVTSNNLVFLAGKGPRKEDGKNIVGKLGKDLTVAQGYEAAKIAGINLLAALKGEIGDLNRVVRIVKVKGMVNAIPEFTDHSKVINGFSDLMVAVFGDKGKHARAAVGMSSLPGNMAVEIEVVVEIN